MTNTRKTDIEAKRTAPLPEPTRRPDHHGGSVHSMRVEEHIVVAAPAAEVLLRWRTCTGWPLEP